MLRTKTLAALAISAAWAQPAQAATFVFFGQLSASNEIAATPVVSPGTGFTRATYDDVANTLRVEGQFARLVGTTTMAHIHCCTLPTGNAGVATTTPTLVGFPLGVREGSFDTTLDLTLASSFNPTFITNNGGTVAGARARLVTGLFAGQSYFNVHTSSFPGGELRANLTAVPEPATWAMMIAGFAGVGGTLRSRRRVPAAA
jgi:hypothetical protein